MRLLLTGATGFIGGALARHWLQQGLSRPGDVEVRALVRNPDRAIALSGLGADLRQGDLLASETLEAACVGSDVVVHAATDTVLSDRAQAWAVSVEGTSALYAAAARSGVKRFVFISSFIVYGGVSGTISEETRPVAFGDLYGDTKIAAEEALLAASRAPGMPELTILRLPSVYGPLSTHWTLKPLEAARRNKVFLPGGGRFGFPYLYIDNLVGAVSRAVTSDRSGIYNVFDGVVPYGEFMRHYCDMVGSRPRVVPLAMLYAAAVGCEIVRALTRRYMPLSLHSVRKLAKPMSQDPLQPEKARLELGWQPIVSLEGGMAAIRAAL